MPEVLPSDFSDFSDFDALLNIDADPNIVKMNFHECKNHKDNLLTEIKTENISNDIFEPLKNSQNEPGIDNQKLDFEFKNSFNSDQIDEKDNLSIETKDIFKKVDILFLKKVKNNKKVKVYDEDSLESKIINKKQLPNEYTFVKKYEKHDGSIIFEGSKPDVGILENAEEIIEKTIHGKTIIARERFSTKVMSQDDYDRYNRIFQRMITDIFRKRADETKSEEDKKNKTESKENQLTDRVYTIQEANPKIFQYKKEKDLITFSSQIMKMEIDIQRTNNEKKKKIEKYQEEKNAMSKEITLRDNTINKNKVDVETKSRNESAEFIDKKMKSRKNKT